MAPSKIQTRPFGDENIRISRLSSFENSVATDDKDLIESNILV